MIKADLVVDNSSEEHHCEANCWTKMAQSDPEDPRNMNKQAPGNAGPADGGSHFVGKCSPFVGTIFFIDDDQQKSRWKDQLTDNGKDESHIPARTTFRKNTKEIFII